MLRKEIGIDIGTTQISICTPDGVLLLREPNVAALDPDTGKVLETGHGALRLHKERKGLVHLCYPAWDGVVKYAGGREIVTEEVIRDIFDIQVKIVRVNNQNVILGGYYNED